jgi:hypothetical protein
LVSCGCVRLSVSLCHVAFKKPEPLREELPGFGLEPEPEPEDGGGGGGDELQPDQQD